MESDEFDVDADLLESTLNQLEKHRFNSKPSDAQTNKKKDRNLTRRLPGPAGNLPIHTKKIANMNLKLAKPKKTDPLLQIPSSPSSSTKSTVHSSPPDLSLSFGDHLPSWQALQQAINANKLTLYVTNVSSILQMKPQTLSSLADNHKIDYMAVMVQAITHRNETEAGVTLRDNTGDITGILHRRVLEAYGTKIKAGTCFLLKDASIFQPSSRLNYVNITMRNVFYLTTDSQVPEVIYNEACQVAIKSLGGARSSILKPSMSKPVLENCPPRAASSTFKPQQFRDSQALKSTTFSNVDCNQKEISELLMGIEQQDLFDNELFDGDFS